MDQNQMGRPVIQLNGVTRTYQLGDETYYALRDVSLSVAAGESVAVMGPSGSGKSTLANIIGGLDRPSAGTVVVDGKDLSKMHDAELSHFRNATIGFIFQAFNLKADSTALENVALPLMFAHLRPSQRKARAAECLETVGLSDRMGHLPTQLSGGQRQRVAIARALANRPSILIADEPTGNLDSVRGEETIEMLDLLNKQGITLMIITHDLKVAQHAHRILNVHDGVLTELAHA
jgi:putative ABC transport system ATP-binding protein